MEARTVGASRRLPNLDVMRGIGAVIVLMAHSYGLGGRELPLYAGSLGDVIRMTPPLFVWMFFAMSGLLIGRPFVQALVDGSPRPSTGGYAVRRIMRVYPLYLACAAAVLLFLGLESMGPKTTAVHLLLLHNLVPDRQLAFINVTWTLSLEVLFYISVPILAGLISLLSRRRPVAPKHLALGIVLSFLTSMVWTFLGGMLDGQPSLSLWVRMLFPAMWSTFCPGLLIAVLYCSSREQIAESRVLRAVDHLRHSARAAWMWGGLAMALNVASNFAHVDWGVSRYLWLYDFGRAAGSVGMGILVLRAADAHGVAERTPGSLEKIGTWSYGIYVIHGAAFTILRGWDDGSLIPMPHGGTIAFIVHTAMLLAITVPLSWLAWNVIEKPAIDAARRFTRKPKPPTAVAPAAPVGTPGA